RGIDCAGRNSAKRRSSECLINVCGRGRDERAIVTARAFLLARRIIKRAAWDDWATGGEPCAESLQIGSLRFVRQWLPGIESAILNKKKRISMKGVHAAFGDHVY